MLAAAKIERMRRSIPHPLSAVMLPSPADNDKGLEGGATHLALQNGTGAMKS
jgi:hypothetical protein